MAHATQPQPLVIAGIDDIEFRHRPLPAFEAVDEFTRLSPKLEELGVLQLLIEDGAGTRLDPRKWDMADAALMMKALAKATGETTASGAMLAIFKRYSVEYRITGPTETTVTIGRDGDTTHTRSTPADWSPLDADAPAEIDISVIPFVAFECLKGTVSPFFDRLKSIAAAKAESQASPSAENVEIS